MISHFTTTAKRRIWAVFFILFLLTACAPSTPDTTVEGVVTLTIDVRTLVDNDDLLESKQAFVPESGYLLTDTELDYVSDMNALSALSAATDANAIALDAVTVGSAYVKGIGQLYAGDCGSGSGWLYTVNGESPGIAANKTELEAGDSVSWIYTCDLGRDVGLSY